MKKQSKSKTTHDMVSVPAKTFQVATKLRLVCFLSQFRSRKPQNIFHWFRCSIRSLQIAPRSPKTSFEPWDSLGFAKDFTKLSPQASPKILPFLLGRLGVVSAPSWPVFAPSWASLSRLNRYKAPPRSLPKNIEIYMIFNDFEYSDIS